MSQQFFLRLMLCVLPLVWCASFTGCSSGTSREMHSFQGTLTFQGEPVAKMMVSFFPVDGDSNPASSGVTNEQGQFKLKVGKTMGVAPGEYIVFLQDPAGVMGGKSSTDPGYLALLKKHGDPEKSELRITVEAAKYDYELKLE